MHHDFWHQKWNKGEIGFHLSEANPLLVGYFSALGLEQGARVFLPLCGKTLDIAWLMADGYHVLGAELSPIAIQDLFESLHLTPVTHQLGDVTHYSAPNIDIFVGDIFDVSPAMLGRVDAVCDRAALVALPDDMRLRYAKHLMALTGVATQLLICYEYDQTLVAGPPFSITPQAVAKYYQENYALHLLATVDVSGGMKGRCSATEHVFLLKPLNTI